MVVPMYYIKGDKWRQLDVHSSSKFHLFPTLHFSLCKFRTVKHTLPVEIGRYCNIDRNLRYCTLCNENILGNEFHVTFESSKMQDLRRMYISKMLWDKEHCSVLSPDQVFDSHCRK